MAKRRALTAEDAFDLRQMLQVATLDALMNSRRWKPGDLVFQGGTSLHLAHGSPRFSEDLDFMIDDSLSIDEITKGTERRLSFVPFFPTDMPIEITKFKEDRNPAGFVVKLAGPGVMGAVRVNVELYRTDVEQLRPMTIKVAPIRIATGPGAGLQATVPSLDLTEIRADKISAMVARPYLKPRDVFDLHWIKQSGQAEIAPARLQIDLERRFAIYPDPTPEDWLKRADVRKTELTASVQHILKDLQLWLPPSWPLTVEQVKDMVDTSIDEIDHGIDLVRRIVIKKEHDVTEDADGPSL